MTKSNNINPKTFAQYGHHITDNQCTKEELNLPDYDLVAEQTEGKELLKLKEKLQSGKASQAFNFKSILLDNGLYYLSKADSYPVIWPNIPQHLRKKVIEQYHDNNSHMEIDKTHYVIKKVLLAKYVQKPISICYI